MSDQRLLAVAFDFDGLMFATEELWEVVGHTLLHRRGHAMRREIGEQMMGRQSQEALQIMVEAYNLDATIGQLEDESEEVFLSLAKQARPMPGFLQLLDVIVEAEIPRAITTSSRPQLIQPILEQWELTDTFAFQLTSADIAKGKPHPEIYLTAAERFDVPAERLLVLEDSPVGVAAGMAANAFTVMVQSDPDRQVAPEKARMVVEQLGDPRIYAALGC